MYEQAKHKGSLPQHESSVETEQSANIEDFHNMIETEQQLLTHSDCV